MYIPVEENIKGKMCKIDFNVNHLYVKVGDKVLVDNDWPEKINVDGSLWTLESNMDVKTIHLSIEKWKNQMSWWDCAVSGHEKIDTKKINPESSNLSDLDGETRSTVEKMMFDMRQKQAGLPNSDELKKKEMLDKFMKTHPDMDFSKCKFT